VEEGERISRGVKYHFYNGWWDSGSELLLPFNVGIPPDKLFYLAIGKRGDAKALGFFKGKDLVWILNRLNLPPTRQNQIHKKAGAYISLMILEKPYRWSERGVTIDGTLIISGVILQ
jgi:hypothetical protein